MYRLLIVDDEPDIADGLFTLFKRQESIDLDIYKAYSGNEALQRLNSTQIDVMLLDINMPGMSGLQLLEKIKADWPGCWVIFLTGYNEFEYIYKAIKYDRVSYILKTEPQEDIIKAVEKAVTDIRESFQHEELLKRAEEQMSHIKPVLQREYLVGLLQGEKTEGGLMRGRFDGLGIPLDCDEPVLLVLGRIDNAGHISSNIERTKLFYYLRMVSDQYFLPRLNNVIVSCESNLAVWMIQPADDAAANLEKENTERIQSILKESMGISTSFVVDSAPVSWSDISGCYSSLKLLLYSRIGFGSDMLYFKRSNADDENERPLKMQAAELNAQLGANRMPKLEAYLESGQKEEFQALLSEMLNGLTQYSGKMPNFALEIFYSVSLMYLSYINRWNLTDKLAFKTDLNRLMRVDDHGSWESAAAYFLQLSEFLFELRRDEAENSAVHVINQICQHISENLDKELSLMKLADMVYFNPSYLSRIFKQHTGRNLLSYINEARVNKAREMLANPAVKIQDIGAALGISSPSYFAQFFKKATGMTPQEYREAAVKI